MADYGPSFRAATLYERRSATGNLYYTGRMGGIKLALVQAKEPADDGTPRWNLLMSEAAPYQPRQPEQPQQRFDAPPDRPRREAEPPPLLEDDDIPF